MASLFEQINTLISANMRSIVDRALSKIGSVMDEYIRQAEKDMKELEESTAQVGGSVRTLQAQVRGICRRRRKMDRDIDTLVLKGKDDLAAAAQTELNSEQQIWRRSTTSSGRRHRSSTTGRLTMRMKLEGRLTAIRGTRAPARPDRADEAKKVTNKTIKASTISHRPQGYFEPGRPEFAAASIPKMRWKWRPKSISTRLTTQCAAVR